jgi:hypothetical protein
MSRPAPLSTRLAATAAVGLLAATSLPGTAVAAAPLYTCVVAGAGGFTYSLAPEATIGNGSIPTGAPLDGLPVTLELTVTQQMINTLTFFGTTNYVTIDEMVLSLGGTEVEVERLASPPLPNPVPPADQVHVLTGEAWMTSAVAPLPGTHPVKIRSTFEVANRVVGTGAARSSCVLETPSTDLPTVTVRKQTAQLAARSAGSARRPAVGVRVERELGEDGRGRVQVMKGDRNVGAGRLVEGRARIALPGLRRGTHRLTVRYAGDSTTDAAEQTVKVKVRR